MVMFSVVLLYKFYVIYSLALLQLFKCQGSVRHLSDFLFQLYENASKLIAGITVESAVVGKLNPLTETNQSANSEIFPAVSCLMELIKKTR
jgi:hypothetical protein